MKRLVMPVCLIAALTVACKQPTVKEPSEEAKAIFPKGQRGPADNFTGKAWNYGLVAEDRALNTGMVPAPIRVCISFISCLTRKKASWYGTRK